MASPFLFPVSLSLASLVMKSAILRENETLMKPAELTVIGQLKVTVRRTEHQIYRIKGTDTNGIEMEVKSNNHEALRKMIPILEVRGFKLEKNKYGGVLHTIVVDRTNAVLAYPEDVRLAREC